MQPCRRFDYCLYSRIVHIIIIRKCLLVVLHMHNNANNENIADLKRSTTTDNVNANIVLDLVGGRH